MDLQSDDHYRLHDLILAYLDDAVDERSREELETALNSDPVARRIFVEQLRLEGALRLMQEGATGRSVAGRWQRVAGFVAAAASLVFSLFAWHVWQQSRHTLDDTATARAQSGAQSVAVETSVADLPQPRFSGRSLVVRVQRAEQPQAVASALRPGDAVASIGTRREHRYDSLDPHRSYSIRVLPLLRR